MHLGQQMLLALLKGQLDEEDAGDAMGHLAYCDDCALRMATLHKITDDFDGCWDDFLQKMSEEGASSRRALAFAVRVLVDSRKRIAAVGTRLVEDLVPSDLRSNLQLNLGYGGVGDPERPPEAEKLQTEAAEHCGEGDFKAATDKLNQAADLHPDAGSVGDVMGKAQGGVPIEVIVDASRPSISVLAHVQDMPASRRPSLQAKSDALLMQPDGQLIRREPFEDVDGVDYWLAEFEDIPDGSWIVGVEFG